MSSSTASERTINTSTESANTILTNITATDGDTTEDSLDLEQNQDLLISLDSASSLDGKPQRYVPKTLTEKKTQNNIGKFNHFTEDIEKTSNSLDVETQLPDTPFICDKPKNDYLKSRDKGPSTAPPRYHHSSDTKFSFDTDPVFMFSQSAKETNSVFDSIETSPCHKNVAKFTFDIPIPTSPTDSKISEVPLVSFDNGEKLQKNHIDGKRNAVNSKDTINEIQLTCDEFLLPTIQKNKRNSVDCRALQRSRRKSSVAEIKSMTPPLPDLRVDFFSDSMDDQSINNNTRPISCLFNNEDIDFLKQECENGTSLQIGKPPSRRSSTTRCYPENANASTVGININVTTNPLDNGSGCCNQSCPSYTNNQYRSCACCSNNISQNVNRKIPQATIVVQQASLSLDYSNVSTLLLKDENDFVSNTTSSNLPVTGQHKLSFKKKKQRDDHMKQLLDVTNQLTREEIHDFEMRYGSPHHSRSQSVKTGTRGLLGPPPQRARVASMPSTGVEEQYYRLRHFSITGKGVVNRGDSLKSRRSRSNTSVASSNSSTEHLTPRASAPPSLASSRESSASAPPPAPYRVLVLGAPGVGKSSLINQFMTSEYLHAYDTSIDDDSGEKSVSVLLAGEESELVFLDQTPNIGPEADIDGPEPNAYCVVYSTADRGSIRTAEGWLKMLRNKRPSRARILVGNKADLVRSRAITSDEGKNLAITYDCKFIETSVGINHNVDELLVGLLTQIRLKQEHPERNRRRGGSSRGGTSGSGSASNTPRKQRGARLSASLKVRGLLGRVWARDSKSKSCENLHVL